MSLSEQLNYELATHQAEISEINEEIGRLILLREQKESNMHKLVSVLVHHMASPTAAVPEQRDVSED